MEKGAQNRRKPNPGDDATTTNRRDRGGFEETPAEQGLKTPPVIAPGEDSGEWTRGGGADPAGIRKPETGPPVIERRKSR